MEGHDFKSEVEAARHDPAQLRKLADEINSSGGSRFLMIREFQLARAADTGRHPLGKVAADVGLPRPANLPLYRYKLAPGLFERTERKLAANLASDLLRQYLAPAFVLWAADWFQRSNQGGVQRWLDIEMVLGLHLPQSEWRNLADLGFRAWDIEPLITAHGNQRLSKLARHGGFPAAAMSSGPNWPRNYLKNVMSALPSAKSQRALASDPRTARADKRLASVIAYITICGRGLNSDGY